MHERLEKVPIHHICISPYQPRREFSEEEIQELAASIIAVGVLHPPLVRKIAEGQYELIAGERRFRAAQAAGLAMLPVIICQGDNLHAAQAALIENIQRVDLNPLEIAKALHLLIEEFHFTQEQLALRIGKKRSTVANYLRLLALPASIQYSLKTNTISMGHAKAILALEGDEKQILLHEIILRDGLNVREAEATAQRIAAKAKKKALTYQTRDFFLEDLSAKIQQRFGTKVVIQAKGKQGRISIDYYNYDDLDRILELLGISD